MPMKKFFAAFSVLACMLMICACASSEPKPEPNYDQVRSNAQEAYQGVDNDTDE